MPKPNIKIAIKTALEESAIYQKSVSVGSVKGVEFKKLANHIENKLYIDF